MPTPKTDGKLSAFSAKLQSLVKDAVSDLKVKESEKASASDLKNQQKEAYILARETANKYADFSKGLGSATYTDFPDFKSVDFEQYLKDTLENQAKLQAQNEVVGTSLATAIASIKDAASKLQTFIKDACNLKSTAQLESSLFDIAEDIRVKAGEIAGKAGDADGPGEYAEFAFNAAVKAAGIQALIGLSNLGTTLADIQTKFGELKSDVDANLSAANDNLKTIEGLLVKAGIDEIDKSHEQVFAENHKNALLDIEKTITDTQKSRALGILRGRITRSANGAQPSLTDSPAVEETVTPTENPEAPPDSPSANPENKGGSKGASKKKDS